MSHVKNALDRATAAVAPSGDDDRPVRINAQLKVLIDAVLTRASPLSDKPMLLFLLAYKLENPAHPLREIPVGWRPADKLLCGALTAIGVTLHGNITAYGENIGAKGNAAGFNLFERKRVGDVLQFLHASPGLVNSAFEYTAWLFRQSYRKPVEIEPLPPGTLTFTKALRLFERLIIEHETAGHFPQFAIAALLVAYHEQLATTFTVRTHHPHASDKSDKAAGDIEILNSEAQVIEAFEVTVRPDWKNRRGDLVKKMNRFGLDSYTVVCRVQAADPDIGTAAALHSYMAPLGKDIAIVDIVGFAAGLLQMLSRDSRARALQTLEALLRDPRLSAVPQYLELFKAELERLE